MNFDTVFHNNNKTFTIAIRDYALRNVIIEFLIEQLLRLQASRGSTPNESLRCLAIYRDKPCVYPEHAHDCTSYY